MLRFIGDNPDADRKEMEYLFPSLLKNVVPYCPPVLQDCPGVMMNLQNTVLLGTKEEANTVGACLTELLNDSFKDAQPGTVFVRLDMEWNAFDTSAFSWAEGLCVAPHTYGCSVARQICKINEEIS